MLKKKTTKYPNQCNKIESRDPNCFTGRLGHWGEEGGIGCNCETLVDKGGHLVGLAMIHYMSEIQQCRTFLNIVISIEFFK